MKLIPVTETPTLEKFTNSKPEHAISVVCLIPKTKT